MVVTIQDESFRNIVPQHREITGKTIYSIYHPFIINFISYDIFLIYSIISIIIVLDVNDNEPQFLNSPYSFSVDETVSVGDILYNSVGVRDLDTGLNGIVNITCDANLSPEACDVFEIKTRNADLVRFSTICTL